MIAGDPARDVTVDADFACGSAGKIRLDDSGRFDVAFKPERIPKWFETLLEELFGGGGVPKEYMAHVRIRNGGGDARQVLLRFLLSPKGCPYMFLPWWVRRETGWAPLAPEATAMSEGEYVETTIEVAAGESVRVASAPYEEPAAVVEKARQLAATSDLWTYGEIGRSAQGRPLPLLTSPDRPLKLLVTATMQCCEPVSWGIMHAAHWLTIPTSRVRRLLDHVQFYLMPMLNPDGVYVGHSVTNAVGEVPKFGINRLVEGKEAPRETAALWNFLVETRPSTLIEIHAHYTPRDFTRSIGMHDKDAMPEELRPLGAAIEEALFDNYHAPPMDNRKVLINPEVQEHDVYGDRHISEQAGCVQTWLQAVPDSIESHCADVREMVETLADTLIAWEGERTSTG